MLVTGALGFLWVLAWRRLYHSPESHPRLSPEEHALITSDRQPAPATHEAVHWKDLLQLKQTWGIVIGRALMDPYWFLVAEWFGIYLVSRGIRVEQSLLGFWAPFLGADLGNFFGAGLSSYWIARGWPVGKARRTTLLIFGPAMLALIPAAFIANYWIIIGLFALASFSYACCATMFLALPADAFHSRAVATVSGMSGTGAGIVTLLSTYLVGQVADRYSFQPVIITASLVPCIATIILVTLVRAPEQKDERGLLTDF
jgi:ACS family hexuronate transporter-like MFS transporter